MCAVDVLSAPGGFMPQAPALHCKQTITNHKLRVMEGEWRKSINGSMGLKITYALCNELKNKSDVYSCEIYCSMATAHY